MIKKGNILYYRGQIYNRPVGRGICFGYGYSLELQLEEKIPQGIFFAEISIGNTMDDLPKKSVFVVKRVVDREGFSIVGIFEKREEAEAAVEIDKVKGYGDFCEISELEIGKYFDFDEPGTR